MKQNKTNQTNPPQPTRKQNALWTQEKRKVAQNTITKTPALNQDTTCDMRHLMETRKAPPKPELAQTREAAR